MSNITQHRIKYLLPPILWMVIISLFSTDHFSGQQTSRFIGPLLRFFAPDIADATVRSIQLVIRKMGHLTEYAILFLLWYRAFNASIQKPLKHWRTSYALWSLIICVLYAAGDEWHQSWTDERVGSPVDVGIDALGAGMALGWVRWRTRQKKE